MTTMPTVDDSLRLAIHALQASTESPRLDAEILLSTVLGMTRTALRIGGTELLPEERRKSYEALIERRLHGTPIAYLTGSREFWSLDLSVSPAVLVPRPETELLVEIALARLPKNADGLTVLDLGTGSGAIALAIATERPRVCVVGVDVSAAALAIALHNSRKLGLTTVEWRTGSWFEAVPRQRFDVIVANPPYLASSDPALTALAAEPVIALAAGATGLEALAAIIEGAPSHLKPHGCLLLEHGSTQAGEVAARLKHSGFAGIQSHADYSGKPRVTLGTWHAVNEPHFAPIQYLHEE